MTGDSLTVAEPRKPDVEQRTVWLHFLAVSALHSDDANAAVTHAHAVGLLSEDVDSCLEAAGAILEQSDVDPLLRWSVVNTVGATQHEACVQFLYEQASADFGERNPEACGEVRDSEVLVGVMAAEGLASLASLGSDTAVEALIDVVRNQREISIREAAGQPLLSVLKRAEQTPPEDIGAELDRIGSLRALAADDVVIDRSEVNLQQPKRLCARKPPTDGGSVAPSAHPTLKGDRNG